MLVAIRARVVAALDGLVHSCVLLSQDPCRPMFRASTRMASEILALPLLSWPVDIT